MDYSKLFSSKKPLVFVYLTDKAQKEKPYLDLWRQLSKQFFVRKIRGKKSKTKDAFFNEAAAALQFPDYYADNWAAFSDFIGDWPWKEDASSFLILVKDANWVLSDEKPDEFKTLLRILAKTTEKRIVPVHVIFHCTKGEESNLIGKLNESKIEFNYLK